MKLIDLLVQELPKRGGWHDDYECVTQDSGGEICAWGVGGVFFDSEWKHPSKKGLKRYLSGNNAMEISTDYSSAIITKYQYQSALEASQKVEWVDGLPPVGCECEVMEEKPLSVFGDWTKCKVVNFNHRDGKESQVCIIDYNGDFAILYANDGYKFRPIHTEAERKRDDVISALTNYTLRGDACDIYDAIAAGKIPGVKLED